MKFDWRNIFVCILVSLLMFSSGYSLMIYVNGFILHSIEIKFNGIVYFEDVGRTEVWIGDEHNAHIYIHSFDLYVFIYYSSIYYPFHVIYLMMTQNWVKYQYSTILAVLILERVGTRTSPVLCSL